MKLLMNFVCLFNLVYASCNGNLTNRLVKLESYDLFGKLAQFANKVETAIVKDLPRWTFLCKTNVVTVKDTRVRLRWVPRGCCATCCSIEHPSMFIDVLYVKGDSEVVTIRLSNKKKRGSLAKLGIDARMPTVIFIHGFGDNPFSSYIRKLNAAYLQRNSSYNILNVDWNEICTVPWYKEAAENTKIAAKEVAEFLKLYHKTGELPIDNMHIIGMSLGAHVAGHIGKMLRSLRKVPRITGLDPAFPLITIYDKTERLCQDDAEFVDILHANPGQLGFPISIGHADFYANPATQYQPGCTYSSFLDNGLTALPSICSHLRSILLYAESVVNPMAFPTVKLGLDGEKGSIPQHVYMGFLCNKRTAKGDYYFTTTAHPPFGRAPTEMKSNLKNSSKLRRQR